MLSLNGLTSTQSSNIFLNANLIKMLPVVSAEWNQNLFNAPYITVAGAGSKENIIATTGSVSDVTGTTNAYKNFTTKAMVTNNGTALVSYQSNPVSSSAAYKIITYVKTSSNLPVIVSSYAKGSSSQFGSTSSEANVFGWTQVVTYIGGQNANDTISSFLYTLKVSNYSSNTADSTIYYTLPEVYATSFFDYQYHSLWPTDSAFGSFRPGESYVKSGNPSYSLPDNFRKINTQTLSNYNYDTYSPISSIIQNPSFSLVSPPVPNYKNVMPTDISPYQYFVSDASNKSISGIYANPIYCNKIIIKLNTTMTVPTIRVTIDSINNYTVTPDKNGLITLYWDGSTWSTTPWSSMPVFNDSGLLSLKTTISKITVTQTEQSLQSQFSNFTNSNFTDANGDWQRMQLIEVSPRLEIDLSPYVEDLQISKSLDSKSTVVPLSTPNPGDTSITLSGIPAFDGTNLIPLFSNNSNSNLSILSGMLYKNIKIYSGYLMDSYSDYNVGPFTSVKSYIPGSVNYVDTWDETDIKEVKIQCYDILRYLQTTPVADYVANLKSVFDIITNILDLSGFTDYDYDSLYKVCNDPATPMDISYFYCNSKDTTLSAALAEIFLAYQIGCYIDEYGVMKFLSLSQILTPQTTALNLTDNHVLNEGYSITNTAKIGKVSVRYQEPKIKQSLALQNATDPSVRENPSFIYTTSNDVVWQQQVSDSLGFNYLHSNMSETDSSFNLSINDLLDIFHTYSLNNNGYAVIENEIVSFAYKQYTISNSSGQSTTVSVKNDLELASEINKFIKKYQSGLNISDGKTPSNYNVIVSPSSGPSSNPSTSAQSITNVQRGMFGTVPVAHTILTDVQSKGLSQALVSGSSIAVGGSYAAPTTISTTNSNAISVIGVTVPANEQILIYPSNVVDAGHHTYSAKFNINYQDSFAGGVFFNMPASMTSTNGAYFVEMTQKNSGTDTNNNTTYQYLLSIYQMVGGVATPIAITDISGQVQDIQKSFAKVLQKQTSGNTYTYTQTVDEAFHIKVVHYYSDGENGEPVGEVIEVFLNNIEITGWQQPDNTSSTKFSAFPKNTLTGLNQSPVLPTAVSTGTKFGAYFSTSAAAITNVSYAYAAPSTTILNASSLREIYATTKPLIDRSVNYWYQDRAFLNGLIQNQNIFNNELSYMMQTNPEIVGINYYDVQYTTPAATNVDVLPVEYLWYYFPGNAPTDQAYLQTQLVDEYSASYSVPLNTGFRAKMAIVNNSPHMVYLNKVADDLNQFTITLNLWTHEIIAPSDPSIIEKVINKANALEVAQIDSPWIQSKSAANKTIDVIAMGVDGFSKDTHLKIFGNPLIQLGDIVGLTYKLTGVNQKKYVVQSVKHIFKTGLETELVLNVVDNGISY